MAGCCIAETVSSVEFKVLVMEPLEIQVRLFTNLLSTDHCFHHLRKLSSMTAFHLASIPSLI